MGGGVKEEKAAKGGLAHTSVMIRMLFPVVMALRQTSNHLLALISEDSSTDLEPSLFLQHISSLF
ncbi:hypothetical protein NC652_014432 [Populus alba x Populus x berolinensis]|nr:hypothetical protein NC652_014432 [Populus alba x Populus x berolinensis]